MRSYATDSFSFPAYTHTRTHIHTNRGKTLQANEIVEDVLSDRADLYVKPGGIACGGNSTKSAVAAPPTGTQQQGGVNGQGQLRCKNYGCNQFFSAESNTDKACKFHTAPPVFHDTKKGWSCCTKRVYDWDEFHTVRSIETHLLTHTYICIHSFIQNKTKQNKHTHTPTDRRLRHRPPQHRRPQGSLCPFPHPRRCCLLTGKQWWWKRSCPCSGQIHRTIQP